MTDAARIDLEVPRNGDYFAEFGLEDIDGNAIDLTGHTLAMSAKAAAGDVDVVASATLAITDASGGLFSVRWQGSDFDSYGNLTALTRAPYDLKHTHPDGVIQIPFRGYLLIVPEVT